MPKLYGTDAESYDALRKGTRTAFDDILAKYNDGLADTVAEPAALTVAAAPAAEAAPAAAPTAPSNNPSQIEKYVAQPQLTDASMGGIPTPDAFKLDPAYSALSYQGKTNKVTTALATARATMLRDGVPPASVNTTIANMTKEYMAALGPKPTRTALQAQEDTDVAIGKGVLGTVKAASDAFGADNKFSAYLSKIMQKDEARLSPQRKDELKYQDEERAALGAGASWTDRAGLTLSQGARNPGATVAEGAGNAAGFLTAGLAGLGTRGMVALSTLIGMGAVKGNIYDAVKNAPEAELLVDPVYADMRSRVSEADAREGLGVLRQTYADNYGKIAFGGLMGAVVGKFGTVEQLAAHYGRNYSAEQLKKILGDSYGKAVAKGVAKEVATEVPQEMAETALGNAGAASGGAAIPLDRGVPEAGAQAGLMVVAPGGAAGAAHKVQANQQARAWLAAKAAAHKVQANQQARAGLAAKAAAPAAAPATASPFKAQYESMNLGSVADPTLTTVDGKDVSMYDVDPAKFEETFGALPSELFDGATDTPTAESLAAPVNTVPPYAETQPGVVQPGVVQPTETPAPAAPPTDAQLADISKAIAAIQDQLAEVTGVRTATEEVAPPRQGTRPSGLEQVETNPPVVADLSQVYTTAEGTPITLEEAQAAQQAAQDLVQKFIEEGNASLAPARRRGGFARTEPRVFNKGANSRVRSLGPPEVKKKALSEGAINADAATSVEQSNSEGATPAGASAGNPEAVARQETRTPAGVGENIQQPTGVSTETKAGVGGNGANTARAGQSTVSRSKQPRRVVRAAEEWADFAPENAPAFEALPPRAQQAWTDAVADKYHTQAMAAELSQGAKSLRVQDKIAASAEPEQDTLAGTVALATERTSLGRPAPLGPAASDAVTAGDTQGALDAIARHGSTPLARAIAARFHEMGLGAVKITVALTAHMVAEGANAVVAGSYDSKRRVVTLDPQYGFNEHAVLHELAHAATLEGINNPRTPEQKAAAMQLYQLYNEVAARLDAEQNKQYGSHSIVEFVAEMYSNPEFQQALYAMKTPAGLSMWKRVRNAILRVAGLDRIMGLTSDDNMLGKSLAAADVLLAPPQGALYGTVPLMSKTDKFLAEQIKKRPGESWVDYTARKFAAYSQPMYKAERGFTVVGADGKVLDSFTDSAAAEAYKAQHPGSLIDERRSMLGADRSPAIFTERMPNIVAARASADWKAIVHPLAQKMEAFFKTHKLKAFEAQRELDLVGNAVSALGANEVGRWVHTALNPAAEGKRRATMIHVVEGTIAPATAMRAIKVLANNPANRALDANGSPVPLYEELSGISDAEAKKIIAQYPDAHTFITQTAKAELDAIRKRVIELNTDAGQFDARSTRIIEMYNQQHYFPLRGKEAGRPVDLPPGFASTEAPVLHTRDGRVGLAEAPFTALINEVHAAHERVVQQQRGDLLTKLFLDTVNGKGEVKARAVAFFKQAGIRYDHSSVLDATEQAKNANEASRGSSSTIVTRKIIKNGGGKVRQFFFTVNDKDNGQAGGNFVSAWAASNNIPTDVIGLKQAAQLTRAYSSLFTRWAPTFAPLDLVRTHETVVSLMLGDFGVRPAWQYVKAALRANPRAIARALAGSPNANADVATAMQEMKAEGGLLTFHTASGMEGTAEKLRGNLGKLSKTKQTATELADFYNEAFEYSPRVAAYMALREHGLTATEAATWSLRTANFSMAGEWTNGFRAFVPFFNPAMQGVRRMGELAHQAYIGNNKARAMVGFRVALSAVAYLVANAMVGKDEKGQDELDKLSPSKNYRNLYMPSPTSDGLIAIPRPLDTGPIDGLGIAVARYLAGHATAGEAISEWAREGLQRLSPVEIKEYTGVMRNLLMPFTGAARPLAEIAANETGIGTPISNDSAQSNKIPALNGRDSTPQAYKDAAALLHSGVGMNRYSPEDIRHLMTQYGAYLGQGLDALANYADDAQPPKRGLAKMVPFVGRFIEDKADSRPRFYEMQADAKKAAAEINSQKTEADKTALRTENPQLAQLADLYKESETALRALGKRTKALGQTPAQYNDTMRAERNRIHDDFIRRFREINQ